MSETSVGQVATPQGDPRVQDVRERLHAAHQASAAPTDAAAAKLAAQNKLYVRDRIALLLDEGSFVEDGRYANAMATGLPADGVVTGRGTVEDRPVVVDFIVHRDAMVWPMVAAGTSNDDIKFARGSLAPEWDATE